MTDTLRDMPRYIRNTYAFGWQGADSPNGPWRFIAPPQSGTPWQTTNPMDDLRQASADVSGVEVLSPAAQAVLDAYGHEVGGIAAITSYERRGIAAALRAAADCIEAESIWRGHAEHTGVRWSAHKLRQVAAELEGTDG